MGKPRSIQRGCENACREGCHNAHACHPGVPRLPFPIVLFILPVLFIITLVPGMLSVLKDLKILGGKVGRHAQETNPNQHRQ